MIRIASPRRRVATIVSAALTGAVVLAVGLTACTSDNGAGVIDTVGAVDFVNPLAIPPLAASTVDASGERVFDLTAQAGQTEFTAGVETDTWGYNGSYLGPTIVAQRGEKVRINVNNDLDEATTVHWHGANLPAEMDGGPHQMVEPGATWSPNFTIDQPAATLWYHPHPEGETEHQVEGPSRSIHRARRHRGGAQPAAQLRGR
jgi:FtsP/CotA-like multicopper oxidase with cupredoxin domain